MKRWRSPALLVFGLALLASAVIHLEAFGVIDVVTMWMGILNPPVASRGPAEIEFEIEGEPIAPANADALPSDESAAHAPAQAVERERERRTPPRRERPVEEAQAPPPTPVAPQPLPQIAQQQAAPPPPQTPDQRQSVRQHSADPSVPPPPNAQFVADQNSQVEEETVATARNYHRDDQEVNPGPADSHDETEEGNADTSESADLREREGSEDRAATDQEAEAERPLHASREPMPHVQAAGDTTAEGRPGVENLVTPTPEPRPAGQAALAGGGDSEPAPLVIHDPMGTFTLPAPRRTGVGAGNAGGAARAGSGLAEFGRGAGAGGHRGQRGAGRGMSQTGPDLRVSWSVLEDTYTPEQLNREREAYVQERRSRIRGGSRERNWREFRAAIENFVPNVRPGNQTALNAAASPFANYLSDVHRRIHREFAERFLPNLPSNMGDFADRSLMTNLEIILNQDGSIHRVGVVQTSGYMPFDYGAFESVMRGQPYPEAPSSILSGDGRVYIHWAFYRSERQCGTFNAEPYILPHPPESAPSVHDGMFQDQPASGGVIQARPRSSAPATGGSAPSDALPRGGVREEAPAGDPAPPAEAPGTTPEPSAPPSRSAPEEPRGGALG
ncbi:MAG: hypothetical protein IPK60_20010 [Sandaracinaceae bacterium]|nr:hypothetical protein [Sandaracinaceae bacterium]